MVLAKDFVGAPRRGLLGAGRPRGGVVRQLRHLLRGATKPQLVQRLRASSEIGDTVNLRHVTGKAVQGPAQGLVARRVWGHAEDGRGFVLRPEHESELVAENRVHGS